MSEIIEHRDNGNGGSGAVSVGEANTSISLKVYQDVYHQITGRTEQIRQRYSDNLLIEFCELEQLHHKVMQLCDVHNIIAKNESISVFHDKERKEQFTSFERFKAYNANAVSPTVSVVVQYNFSLIPAGLQRPQEYEVTIRLTSRVSMIKQLEKEAPPFMRGRFFSYIGDSSAEVTIDYADYVIARGFLEAFDEWIKGCPAIPKKDWLVFLRRWSNIIPNSVRLISAVLLGFFATQAIPLFISATSSPQISAKFFVLYSSAMIVILTLSRAAGDLVEDAIDSYPVLSYLKLNKGDDKLIEEFRGRKTMTILQFLGGCLLAVALNIISSKLEKLM